MKLEQLPHGQCDELDLTWSGATDTLPASFLPGTEARLHYADRDQLALLAVGADMIEVAGDGRRHADLLAAHCTRHLPHLVRIVGPTKRGLRIRIHTFLHTVVLPSAQIGIDEKGFEALARIARTHNNPTRAIDWLREQFLLAGEGDGQRAFATAGHGTSADAFALLGRSAHAFIRRDPEKRLLIDKIVRGQAQGQAPIALVTGDIQFVDATMAGRLRASAAAELDALSATGSSFLDQWRRYGEIEREMTIRRARESGQLAYTQVESLPEGTCRFTLDPRSLADTERFVCVLREAQGLGIEAAEQIPVALITDAPEERQTDEATEQPPVATFEPKPVWNRRDGTLTLPRDGDQEATLPSRGFLFVSLRGDQTRLKRRDDAQRAIRQASCPMPQLGLLLEGKPVPVPRRGTLPALTPAVSRKVFGAYAPTPTQEEALRVALNTPDIALIQGPPGTGKTTIIVALVERLQEVWDSSDGVQGRLLLSGFQHDAVENAIARMSANGLPPIKFGGRRQRGEADNQVDRVIEDWARGRADAIRKRLPQRPPSALQRLVAAQLKAYLLAPGVPAQTAAMLERTADSLGTAVSAARGERLRRLANTFAERARVRRQDPERTRALCAVRALRHDTTAFTDDGPRNACRLSRLTLVTPLLAPADLALLNQAIAWHGPDAPPFLRALGDLRRRLLLALLPADRTEDSIPQVNTEVLAALGAVRDELALRQQASRDGADEAVLAFLETLEGDHEAVKRAVIACTSVFAATCQQSARKELADLKGTQAYDTVVVDEAARATPLDLLIPLARAGRRIVLVGDHRQLPHIVDQQLERELEGHLAADGNAQSGDGESKTGPSAAKNAQQCTLEWLKESLFERLFNDLRQRESRDGIRRTVTLDEQYRMHPLLGEFISAQFYAPYGEAFRSPRPASDFAHDLPGWPGPAGWLDVPAGLDPEISGQSKSRPVEARALVHELKHLMDHPAAAGLTFGIITFYSAQVAEIGKALMTISMAAPDEDGGLVIVDPYRELHLPSGRLAERLRFGTVDAFQGMEFDVVLLSMVRSNALPGGSELAHRRRYGHLMSPNRLCVAMSRQQRLLILVGDGAMLEGPDARAAIGPLVAFRELCEVHNAERL
ncbi:DEAD/DEAH box helicase [Thiocapsa roseopersicina]|uniref:AAA domain-containing protein n=1 Tax=Thiocapsa roseopersicina TaxID=1058 RepID=A0A1H2YAJ8_THIRO|nr:AAA domain-containing protein [Thiocapsa roseopersicina]SDX01704.1 AAA domain-containing protein [Thiocapsa roseopersicina]